MRTKMRAAQPSTQRAPTTHHEWQKLLGAVLERAQSQGYNTQMLQKAFSQEQAEYHLRRLGIIGPADIDRVFPLK